ncbi:ankyrin repeat domain-containing protein [Ottowia thiooxydans]|uniref:ankyrin repeat domain-containing protein n=1 Tax=Ottowia thiooxydans TaxID=219182 RepID=UPI003F4F6F06
MADLLKKPEAINQADAQGHTALMLAVRSGHTETVRILAHQLKKPEAINQADGQGHTALMWAVRSGHTETVRILADLLKKPEAINKADGQGRTALMLAAGSGHTEAVQIFVDLLKTPEAINQVDVQGRNALAWAAGSGHAESVRILADLLKTAINSADDQGQTALMLAAKNGHTEPVRILANLLESRSEINKTDGQGHTPLMWAARSGHTESVRILAELLKRSGGINQPDPQGINALMLAAQHGHLDVIRVLANTLGDLEALNHADAQGTTALMFAVSHGHSHCVELLAGLMDRTSLLNRQRRDGSTAMMMAAERGDVRSVIALRNGSGFIFKDNGDTALSLAHSRGHSHIVRLLLDSLIRTNRSNNTPAAVDRECLRIAGLHGHFGALINWLKQCGNDKLAHVFFTALDSTGVEVAYRPDMLDRAADYGFWRVASTLLQRGTAVWTSEDRDRALALAADSGHFSVLNTWAAQGLDVSGEIIIRTLRAIKAEEVSKPSPKYMLPDEEQLKLAAFDASSLDEKYATVLSNAAFNDWEHLAHAVLKAKAKELEFDLETLVKPVNPPRGRRNPRPK